jgi:hypothetical protein
LELRAGTRCSSLDGSQGTWLEFHRVINADRASMMQSPAGRDSMQFPRWIPRDLVGVPSSDQRRPGRKYADVGKRRAGTRCTTMDPRAGSMHNLGSMGRDSMQFPQSIPWGPVLVGAAGRDSMQFPRWIPRDLVGVPSSDQRRPGRKYADVGKHWLNVCRRRQTLVERRQTPGRDSMHNHGSMGQHDAQPWIPGPEVCTTMDPRGPGWSSLDGSKGPGWSSIE